MIFGERSGKLALGIHHGLNVFGHFRLLLRGTALVDFGCAGESAATRSLFSLLLLDTGLGWGLGRCDCGAFAIIIGEILLLDLAEADLGGGTIAVSTARSNGVPVYLKWYRIS